MKTIQMKKEIIDLVDYRKLDFSLFVIIAMALFSGFLLYFVTAPHWDDGPPIPKTFLIYRLMWFPICVISSFTSYFFVYYFLNFPPLKMPFKLFISVYLALNLSNIFIFLVSYLYIFGEMELNHLLAKSPFILFLIGIINVISTFGFGLCWVTAFVFEKILNKQQYNLR